MFQNIVNQILYWLWPSRILKHFSSFLDRWQRADARERGILLLVFSPLAVCLGGLLFSIFSFVLFVLPSFVLRVQTRAWMPLWPDLLERQENP